MSLKKFLRNLVLASAVFVMGIGLLSPVLTVSPQLSSTVFAQADEEGEEEEEKPTCEEGGWTLSWFICPVLFFTDATLRVLESMVNNLLEVPNAYVENDELKHAASRIRNLAYIIILPISLVMVIGTALGFEFVSAYTVKRALPRLLIAILFIALSFEITKFLVVLTNDIGRGISGIILGSFAGAEDVSIQSIFQPDNADSNASAGIAGLVTVIVGVGILATGTIGMFLSLLLVAAIGLLVGFVLLSLRQMLIIALMLLAPLAILAWIFPGNDRLWKTWWGTFSKLLLLFPLIMLLIATGKAFASIIQVTDTNFVATFLKLVAYVGPFFMIPATFKFAGSTFATLAGWAQNKERGLFDRQRGYRAKERERKGQETAERRNRFGQSRASGLYRRYKVGGFGAFAPTKGAQAKYDAQEKKLREAVARKSLEEDGGRAAGNDDANTLLQQAGMTQGKFVSLYADILQSRNKNLSRADAESQAFEALKEAEVGYGARIGTAAMETAAYKAKMNSITGYNPKGTNAERGQFIREYATEVMQKDPSLTLQDALSMGKAAADDHFRYRMYEQIEEDSASMVARGYMTAADTVAAQKGNTKRSDISGVSFGTALKHRERSAQAYANGARGADLFDDTETVINRQTGQAEQHVRRGKSIEELQQTILDGGMAGAILGQRKEAVQAMVPVLRKNIQKAVDKLTANPDNEAVQREFADAVATATAWHQIGGQISPQNREVLTDDLMEVKLSGFGNMTIRQVAGALQGRQGSALPTPVSDRVVERFVSSHYEISDALQRQAAEAEHQAERQRLEAQRQLEGGIPGSPHTPPGMQG